MADVLDTADALVVRALARLGHTLSAELDRCADDLADGIRATPWQCLPLARRLGSIHEHVDFLRKEVDRLVRAKRDEDDG